MLGFNATVIDGVSNQINIGDAIYASDIGLNAQKMMIGPAARALFTPDYGMNIVGDNYDNFYPANFAVVDSNTTMSANV